MEHTISLFEFLEFQPNENAVNTNYGQLFDCIKICKENPEIESIVRKFINCGWINMHEAAIFAVYFGEPKKEEEREKWKLLSSAEKITLVLNKMMETGIKSFTKLT